MEFRCCDDQPRSETCKQIALAIRDEVLDLEKAGVKIIQIDEAALREGLPIRKGAWQQYLDWAVESFRLTAGGVMPATQVHTHMCYSEFNDIIAAVAAMDADVISIETSRSAMELLDAFVAFKYPSDIGPGVYDIHSPRVPTQEEMETLLNKALDVLSPQQLWVNPDCGLKTRGWKEVEPAKALWCPWWRRPEGGAQKADGDQIPVPETGGLSPAWPRLGGGHCSMAFAAVRVLDLLSCFGTWSLTWPGIFICPISSAALFWRTQFRISSAA